MSEELEQSEQKEVLREKVREIIGPDFYIALKQGIIKYLDIILDKIRSQHSFSS